MTPTKQTPIRSGWIPEACRDRIATCRRNAPHYRAMPPNSRYSYRVINANLYLQYKARLRASGMGRTRRDARHDAQIVAGWRTR